MPDTYVCSTHSLMHSAPMLTVVPANPENADVYFLWIDYGTYCIPYTWYAIEYVLSICYQAYHALRVAYIVDKLLRSWYAACYSLSSCHAAKRVSIHSTGTVTNILHCPRDVLNQISCIAHVLNAVSSLK